MKRLLLVGAIAVAGSLMLASAAAITFDPNGGGAVGSGSALVEGFEVQNVSYELDTVDPSNVELVTFSLNQGAGEVSAKVEGAGWTACTDVSVAPAVGVDWSCNFEPDPPAAGILNLDVAAGS